VNSAVLAEFFRNSNNLFGLYDSFTAVHSLKRLSSP
jgi:hypothetical protein